MVEQEEKGKSEFLAINTARIIAEQLKVSEEEKRGKKSHARRFIDDLKKIKQEMLLDSAQFHFEGRAEILMVDIAGRVLLVRKGNPMVEIFPDKDFELLLELSELETTNIQTIYKQ